MDKVRSGKDGEGHRSVGRKLAIKKYLVREHVHFTKTNKGFTDSEQRTSNKKHQLTAKRVLKYSE